MSFRTAQKLSLITVGMNRSVSRRIRAACMNCCVALFGSRFCAALVTRLTNWVAAADRCWATKVCARMPEFAAVEAAIFVYVAQSAPLKLNWLVKSGPQRTVVHACQLGSWEKLP